MFGWNGKLAMLLGGESPYGRSQADTSSRNLPGQPGGAEGDATAHHVLDFGLGQPVAHDPALGVETHLLETHARVVDEIARELHAPPLVARRGRQVIHQRALLGEEAEQVAVPAQVHELLHQREHLVLGLAHADDDVRAELLRSEDVARVEQDLPVLLPLVRRLHALAARAVEEGGRGGIERHGEDVGAELAQLLDVRAVHGGRVGENRDRDRGRVDPGRPRLQDGHRVRVRARVRDHRDAHAMKGALLSITRDALDDLGRWNGRPVHADEIAVGIVAIGFAMAREPAIRAVGAAAFRVGEQQVEAACAAAAVHPAGHDAERDRRRVRHLHVLRRAHLRREHVVVRQVDALRRHRGLLHPRTVSRLERCRGGCARLHARERIDAGALALLRGRGIGALVETAHRRTPIAVVRRVMRRRCWPGSRGARPRS